MLEVIDKYDLSVWSLERAAGIEPASLAWKAKVLPLHNARAAFARYAEPNGSSRQDEHNCRCEGLPRVSLAADRGGQLTFLLALKGSGTAPTLLAPSLERSAVGVRSALEQKHVVPPSHT